MRIAKAAALSLCAALALAGLISAPRLMRQSTVAAPLSTAEPEPDDAQETLFPALDPASIVDVSVTTPERVFHFHADEGGVSVNGQVADAEVFSTLLSQIAALPVLTQEAFAEEDTPLLTLTIQAESGQMAAAFYRDEASETYARVVSAAGGARQYRYTKAWQIGKLLLTCDGTRIQDEAGHETPAQ